MKFAIIYHNADFDGKFSREACVYHLRQLYPNAELVPIGWDYGLPLPADSYLDQFAAIYIVDLSVPELMDSPKWRERIVWIDHHKSAIDKYDAPGAYKFQGFRIDGVAACRLVWNWFATLHETSYRATKEQFIERQVTEPLCIRLAGEYDIWDHRDERAKPFQFGLRTLSDPDFTAFAQAAFQTGDVVRTGDLVNAGRLIKDYVDSQSADYAKTYAHTIRFCGLTFCALNVGQRGNSDLFLGGLKPEHDACFGWRFDGKQALVSLYHTPDKKQFDLSKIAVKFGGGGHRGACGFRVGLGLLAEILDPASSYANEPVEGVV